MTEKDYMDLQHKLSNLIKTNAPKIKSKIERTAYRDAVQACKSLLAAHYFLNVSK